MKQKDLHFQAFTNNWFAKNQKLLLWVFNLVYKFFPSLFFKSGERDDFKGNKIIEVGNNHATCDAGLQYFKKSELIKTASENPENNHRDRRIYKTILRKIKQGKIKEEMKLLPARKTVFFTDWNYSKMLYNAFKPMWWAMHWWDELVADKWVPQLSFGFSTLEVYPNYSGESGATTFDGHVLSLLTNETWANAHSGTTTTSSDSSPSLLLIITPGSSSNTWNRIYRNMTLFDTSVLTTSAVISAAVLSVYGFAKNDDTGVTPTINIYTATPASNTVIADADFSQFGTTAQCDTAITYAGFSTAGYNDFTLNSTGKGNISKTSISKFGIREVTYDVANSAPTWSASLFASFQSRSADYGSNKPKLVVTYTVVSGPANLKSWNGLASASIKSINGVAIADIKKWNGLA